MGVTQGMNTNDADSHERGRRESEGVVMLDAWRREAEKQRERKSHISKSFVPVTLLTFCMLWSLLARCT